MPEKSMSSAVIAGPSLVVSPVDLSIVAGVDVPESSP